MRFVCDAPPKTWFRFETQGEADVVQHGEDDAAGARLVGEQAHDHQLVRRIERGDRFVDQ